MNRRFTPAIAASAAGAIEVCSSRSECPEKPKQRFKNRLERRHPRDLKSRRRRRHEGVNMTRFTRKLALLLLGGMLCPVLSQMQAQSTQSSILGTVQRRCGSGCPPGESHAHQSGH